MIVGIVGWKDSGKTLIMTLLLYMEKIYYGSKILTNYDVTFKDDWLKGQELMELSPNLTNSAIGIDEIHMLADSRLSIRKQNRVIGYFVLQSRHRSVNLYYTTQFEGQVDKRIRNNTDVEIICFNLHIDSDGDGDEDMFRIIIKWKSKPREPTILNVYGKPIFGKYDTDYTVDIFEWKDNKPIKKMKNK